MDSLHLSPSAVLHAYPKNLCVEPENLLDVLQEAHLYMKFLEKDKDRLVFQNSLGSRVYCTGVLTTQHLSQTVHYTIRQL